MKGIIGKKIGMTRIFDEHGDTVPVTIIKAGPCQITDIKTVDRDGYSAVQLGFEERKEKRVKKPQRIDFQKKSISPKKIIREIKGFEIISEDKNNKDKDDDQGKIGLKTGDEVNVNIFKPGDSVDITGVSKGKGFQGGVKRWGWSIGPKSHGSRCYRVPGSIGASADPAKVVKGKHMPGRMGGKKTTVKNIKIIKVEEEKNILAVKGSVPGSDIGYLVIKESLKQ